MPTKRVIKILTPKFRVSYPHVFEPRGFKAGAKQTYNLNMLFPKTTDLSELRKAVIECAKEKWGEDFQKFKPISPFKDGDKKEDPNYHGMTFVVATSTMKPGLVAADAKTPITEPSMFYAGCWARATINPFWWENSGKRGVSFGIQNLQKLADDEPFTMRGRPEDDFEPVEGGDFDDPSKFQKDEDSWL